MNIETLQNIKIVENDHTLEILILNQTMNISLNALLAVKDLGNITIAVNDPMAASSLVGKLCGMKNYKVVLTARIPARKYDVLLANTYSEIAKCVFTQLKTKYVCYFYHVNPELMGHRYVEFADSCFKMKQTENKPAVTSAPAPAVTTASVSNSIAEEAAVEAEAIDNESENYEMIIKDVASTEMEYRKFGQEYVNDVVPGMVSIIMIVSENNNKFAETLRALRAQNVASIEYIIVDNAAGFRNNVKPNIRYGEKMDEDLCITHAKELCSGEYMIIMNQDSDEINILEEIEKGKYETR